MKLILGSKENAGVNTKFNAYYAYVCYVSMELNVKTNYVLNRV